MSGIFTIISLALIFKGIKVDEWYYIIGGSVVSIAAAICYFANHIVDDENNEGFNA